MIRAAVVPGSAAGAARVPGEAGIVPLGAGIRAVLFDVDDTLIDFGGASARGLAAWLGDVAPQLSAGPAFDTALARWRALDDTYFTAFSRGELTFTEQRRYRARDFCTAYGLPLASTPAAQDRWFAGLLRNVDAEFRPFPDVDGALRDLAAAGYRVGAVSNSDSAYQDRKLRTAGLRHRLATLTCCDHVGGVGKPDPRIFHAACAALGFAPHETAYVGDRLDSDARAAAAAGLTGIWLDRHGAGQHHDPQVLRVTDLGGLISRLRLDDSDRKGDPR